MQTPPPTNGAVWGQTRASNLFPWGQCTWGAEERMHQVTGRYINVYRNAYQWAGDARAAGWKTAVDAVPHSIVVFQPRVNGSDPYVGHVGWVEQTQRRADGSLWALVNETHAFAGLGHFDQHWYKDIAGMSYILVP
jgi:surface antigen